MIAIIVFFFTIFSLLNFTGTRLLKLILSKLSKYNTPLVARIMKLKDKEQRIVAALVHFMFMCLITSSSLWIVIQGWTNSKDPTAIDNYENYLIVMQISIGFYLYDVYIMRAHIKHPRLIHHFVTLFGYVMTLEQPKIMFYTALMSVEAYKFPLIIIQILYYLELETIDTKPYIPYVMARAVRCILWTILKFGSITLSIVATSLHGLPDVDAWCYTMMLTLTVSMAGYNFYILYQDLEYFYKLIKLRLML